MTSIFGESSLLHRPIARLVTNLVNSTSLFFELLFEAFKLDISKTPVKPLQL